LSFNSPVLRLLKMQQQGKRGNNNEMRPRFQFRATLKMNRQDAKNAKKKIQHKSEKEVSYQVSYTFDEPVLT
jgi:hypothetical protein